MVFFSRRVERDENLNHGLLPQFKMTRGASTIYKIDTIFVSQIFFRISVGKNYELALQAMNIGKNRFPCFYRRN